MSDPRWYRKLPRAARDAWDQTGHFWIGFGFAAVGSGVAAWGFMHWREFIRQAPIKRIDDTERDMRFSLYGAILGQGINLTWVSILASAIF